MVYSQNLKYKKASLTFLHMSIEKKDFQKVNTKFFDFRLSSPLKKIHKTTEGRIQYKISDKVLATLITH